MMFPTVQLVDLAARFQQTFPGVVPRMCIEVLGDVWESVLTGKYAPGSEGSASTYEKIRFLTAPLTRRSKARRSNHASRRI